MTGTGECSIKVNHGLLGYERGHRLLASSKELKSTSKHILLQFSDRSVDVNEIPKSGYLTGYPLDEDGLYVIARTWAAPEIPRPGCIWTHSLLISFTELAQLDDPRRLLPLFRRPAVSGERNEYTSLFEIELLPQLVAPRVNHNLARQIVGRLYSEPSSQIFMTVNDQKSAESTLIAIWGQQWPRLRRNFRFCTLTAKDRSTSQHRFDIQFTTGHNMRNDEWSSAQLKPDDAWIDLCINDLEKSDSHFRQFLKRAGGDLSGGRVRFAELCRLFALRQNVSEITAIENTLSYVANRLPPNEGRLLRSSAVADAARLASELSTDGLITMLPLLNTSMDVLDSTTNKILARRYWGIDPKIVINSKAPEGFRSEIDDLIASLKQKDAVASALQGGEVAKAILSRRIDVLSDPEIWRSEEGENAVKLLPQVSGKRQTNAVLSALIEASRSDLAIDACEVFGAEKVLMTALSNDAVTSDAAFMMAAKAFCSLEEKEIFVSTALTNFDRALSKRIIHLFTKHVRPETPLNKFSDDVDPWVVAWRSAYGDIAQSKLDSVMMFFAARAITVSEAHAASLLSVAYDPLYDLCSSGRVGYKKRAKLSRYLLSPEWFDWSFEGRLARTVARIAVKNGFTASQLNSLSNRNNRVSQIIRAISASQLGRDYLERLEGDD